MEIVRRLPAPDLRPYVQLLWWVAAEASFEASQSTTRIFPKGAPEIIIPIGGRIRVPGPDGQLRQAEGAGLIGPFSETYAFEPGGKITLGAATLTPQAIPALFATGAPELRNVMAELDWVLCGDGRRLAEQAHEMPTHSESAFQLIERYLRRRLAKSRPPEREMKRLAAAQAALSRPGATVATAAAEACLSPRQLERAFRLATAYSPKEWQRIRRFQTALTWMRRAPEADLLEIALAAGYHDLAHFGRQFKTFAGDPPATYRQRYIAPAAAATAVPGHPPV